ncbi:hypothetical protein K437DRAFT_259301 [Tilletiaria anomala UBC 951]|uniref:Expansin-like EG45 domain-containing protein n=1 Tax=Tilletiaria anomala (strain ATCC 24038 / CBS 436.72 / UBC 951) TaxID=1037660 RepID=A0A066VIZ1_TILAU|nr:uncharacterized protein K437DRAFT_259301 [Tilletiaria anomala UBC 951]KDN38694.1 hypothetical protein K437DRAFT_259301 [Tilletiaria anomala UBC 951]
MTHYELPKGWVASCGCVGRVTYHPVAALNRLAYGSNTSFGPACGTCVKLVLKSTPLTPLPGPDGTGGNGIAFDEQQQDDGEAPSVVVKIADLCPGLGGPHCNATVKGPNALGSYVHFDLAWPSPTNAIPANFFPGDHDYGVWNVTYAFVSCQQWAGYNDAAALGSEWGQQNSACCPDDPVLPSNTQYGLTILQSAAAITADGLVGASSQRATCPPYWSTRAADPAIVPNTSNILSKDDGIGNSAASFKGESGAQRLWTLPWLAAGLVSLPPLLPT